VNIRRLGSLAAVAVIAAACSSAGATGTPTTAPATQTPPASQPATATATATFKAADLNIGFVVKTFSNPYWVALQSGATDEAAKLGVKITTAASSSETAIQEQTDKLTTMAGQNFNCFIVAPINPTNLVTPLKTIAGKNIPIINVDTAIDAASLTSQNIQLTSFIASNNETAGKLDGQQMAKLNNNKGKVALIGGIAGDPNSAARIKGFSDAVTAAGMTIVDPTPIAADWDAAKAQTAATTLLTANPDLVGIMAANDGMGLGIQQAVDAKRLTGKVLVMGVDGDAAAFTSILASKYAATVAQSPYAMGVMSVDACLAVSLGKTVPAKVDSPTFLITKDNAAAAQAAAPKPPASYDNPFTALISQ
jgi:ribose transport system substrate-binding protein